MAGHLVFTILFTDTSNVIEHSDTPGYTAVKDVARKKGRKSQRTKDNCDVV